MPKTKKSATKKEMKPKSSSKSSAKSAKNKIVSDVVKPYNLKQKFDQGDLIDHPKFGSGTVQDLIDSNKISVNFKDKTVLLIHNMQ